MKMKTYGMAIFSVTQFFRFMGTKRKQTELHEMLDKRVYIYMTRYVHTGIPVFHCKFFSMKYKGQQIMLYMYWFQIHTIYTIALFDSSVIRYKFSPSTARNLLLD